MPYSASVSAVTNALSGIRMTYQAMDMDEMEEAFGMSLHHFVGPTFTDHLFSLFFAPTGKM